LNNRAVQNTLNATATGVRTLGMSAPTLFAAKDTLNVFNQWNSGALGPDGKPIADAGDLIGSFGNLLGSGYGFRAQQRMNRNALNNPNAQGNPEFGVPTRQDPKMAPGEVQIDGYRNGMPVVRHGPGVDPATLKIHQDMAWQTGRDWNPMSRLGGALNPFNAGNPLNPLINRALGLPTATGPAAPRFGSQGYEFKMEDIKHRQMAESNLARAQELRQKGDIEGANRLELQAQQYRLQADQYAAIANDPTQRNLRGDNYIAANRELTPEEAARIGNPEGLPFSGKDFPTPELIQATNDPAKQQKVANFANQMAETANQFGSTFGSRLQQAKGLKQTIQISEEGYQWWTQQRYEMDPKQGRNPNPKILNDILPGDPNRDPFGRMSGLLEDGQSTPAFRTRANIGELINQRFAGMDPSVTELQNQIQLPKWVVNELGLQSQVVLGNKLFRGEPVDAIHTQRLQNPDKKPYAFKEEDNQKFLTETAEPANQKILHDAGVQVMARLLHEGSDLSNPKSMGQFSEAAYFLFQGPLKNRGSDSVIRGYVSSMGQLVTGKPLQLPHDVDVQAYARDQQSFQQWLMQSLLPSTEIE
jgi:hypothetical protein